MVVTSVVLGNDHHNKKSILFVTLIRGNAVATLRCVAKAADSLCDGDLVEKKIRSSSNWGLLPLQVYAYYLYIQENICSVN